MPNDNKKFERINKKTSIINFFPRIFYKVMNFLRYKHIYIFDTNMVALKNNEFDSRIKRFFSINRSYFVTDIIRKEIDELLTGNNFSIILKNKLNLINFDDLRFNNPEVCVLYHNYITGMHNPANVNSPAFSIECLFAQKFNDKNYGKNEKIFYMKMMDKVKRGVDNTKNVFGVKKQFFEKSIDQAYIRLFRKKAKAASNSDKNYFNDYKNLSLALIFTLLNRTNTTFITADYDLIAIFSIFIESAIQELTIKKIIGNRLGEKEKKELMQGKRLTFFIDKKEFDKLNEGLRSDVLSRDWKKNGFYFKIKFWDNGKNKYFNSFHVNFNELTREIFLNLHGQLSCHTVKNNTYFNWLGFLFWWPPSSIHDYVSNFIKIVVFKKSLIRYKSSTISNDIHNSNCLYSELERQNKITNFSTFYTSK